MIRLNVEFSAAGSRTDLDDYVCPLDIAVTCSDEEGWEAYIVGKLAMDQILWGDAQTDGESLFEICARRLPTTCRRRRSSSRPLRRS